MKKSLIFDLDQTLVDSSLSESERKNRNWPAVYSLIPSFSFYDGMKAVLQTINYNNIDICIITTSPGKYAQKVLTHFGIPYKHLIDYFSVSQRKPHPEAFYQAMKLLKCDSEAIYSFGDRAIDIQASKAANITSVGCTWGSNEIELLKNSQADYIINSPKEILDILNLSLINERPLAF